MKSEFRRFTKVFLLIICIFWISCDGDDIVDGSDNNGGMATAPFSFEVNVINHLKLRLEGINGNVVIAGISGANSVMITGERRVVSESAQDAQAHLPELQVTVQDLTNEVFVKTTQPQETDGRNYVVDYSITLPRNLEVFVDIVNGNVTIDSVNNTTSVDNVNGIIDLNDIVGSTSVALVNGQIDAEVTIPINGTIDMTTVNGNINLAIPVSTSANFSANVTNGNITVSNLVLQDEVSTPTSLSGRFGNGQGMISLSTDNGIIAVSGF